MPQFHVPSVRLRKLFYEVLLQFIGQKSAHDTDKQPVTFDVVAACISLPQTPEQFQIPGTRKLRAKVACNASDVRSLAPRPQQVAVVVQFRLRKSLDQ